MGATEDRRRAWRDRRVLITGHTGFKGAWLSLWLQRLGAEVTGFAQSPPSDPSLFDLANVAEGMRSVRGDVRELDSLLEVFRECRPEVVLHMAAQALVRPGYDQPVETFGTNVMGTVHVLEAVRRTPGVRAAVIVTSDKCYENHEWMWPYRENEPMGGIDPYSSSKGCAELVTAAYRRSFFDERDTPQVASARAGNVIGGGDWAMDRLIPDFVRGLLAGREIHIRSPHAVRPWQHVLEALDGYLLLAERLLEEGSTYAGAWNFGPCDADTRPVSWVIEHLAEAWRRSTGGEVAWSVTPGDFPREAEVLKLDSTKARSCLGWRNRLYLADALEWIVEWTRCYERQGDVRALTEEQIGRFELMLESDSESG